ncbi:MAG: DNA topoisomerase I [Candidatus Micrarchaeia archaeon]|jgi:DNA topoisomerase-1
MKLVICEKPKVAEKIAYAIGRGKADRKSANGVPYYEVERDGAHIVVVSAVGHLYTLRQAEGTGGYPVYNIEWAPSSEVEKDADYTKKYVDAIKKLAPGADEYICACDYDVEGSLIGYNALRFACGTEVGSRMKFSALTQDDLENAYLERGKLDVENALAGEARHILDWYYGINLSRALMASIRSAGASYKQTMSIGRVQGPALAILAKKEKEISAFVSKPYWELWCKAKDVRFDNVKGRFEKREEADGAMKASSADGSVEKVERKDWLQAPPPPFDLTSLQVEAHRALGIAPARTLELAQTLYEASMISYPRTSSQKLPAKLNLRKIVESLSKNPAYEKTAKAQIAEGRFTPAEGKKEDPAHPAIHPTGQGGQVGDKEMRLYDLIAKRFLACFGKPAKRETLKVSLLSGTEHYAASGSRTVEMGWFDAYAPYVKMDEITLPAFVEGEKVAVSGFKVDEKKTQPPRRYTAASIISELEKMNLGTKATRAAVIETLFKRGYLEGESIRATPFGLAVYDLLAKVAPEIMDEELTKSIEEEMEKIADGENEKKAIEDGKKVLDAILKKFEGNEKDIGFGLLSGLRQKDFADSMLGKCVKCGGDLRAIRSRMGKQFVGCSGYPDCKATYPLPQEAKIMPLGKACEKCGTPLVRVIRKAKKPFEMCIDPTCETKKNWGSPNYQRSAPSSAAKAAAAPAGTAKGAAKAPAATIAAAPIAKATEPLASAARAIPSPKAAQPAAASAAPSATMAAQAIAAPIAVKKAEAKRKAPSKKRKTGEKK